MADVDGADGAVPSPNIWYHPEVYELENRDVDPERRIDAAVREVADWGGRTVLDVGCGAGYFLPRLLDLDPGGGEAGGVAAAAAGLPAARVVAVEPHPPLLARARERVAALGTAGRAVEVLEGTAQDLPCPDASVDVALARWAYFFGPGCEPGLAELERVVRPGGVAVVVDTDASRSTFGAWFRRAHPRHDPAATARFWRRQGWSQRSVDIRWRMPDRETFEAVVRIELPPALADEVLARHEGTELDDAVAVRWRRY